MNITKLIVKNFKSLKDVKIELNSHLNILVGDNEAGKSTLLEAINLVLSGQFNGRNIQYELTPHLFNEAAVNEYVESIRSGKGIEPPSLSIEAYLTIHPDLAKYQGTQNLLRENCPGLKLIIELDEEYKEPYTEYISRPKEVHTIPIEFYIVHWYDFAGNPINPHRKPMNVTFIDTSILRAGINADRYILKIINEVLEPQQRVDLSLAYRKLKDLFLDEASVKEINKRLSVKKGDITDKVLTVSMDVSPHSAWETK